jgi:hypothetical protein
MCQAGRCGTAARSADACFTWQPAVAMQLYDTTLMREFVVGGEDCVRKQDSWLVVVLRQL